MKLKSAFAFVFLSLACISGTNANPFKRLPGKEKIEASPKYFATYQGLVVNQSRKPIPGVQLFVSGTGATATTVANGTFSITAQPGDTLLVDHPGFRSLRYVLSEATTIELLLERDNGIVARDVNPVQLIYHSVPANLSVASTDVIYSPEILKSPTSNFRNTLTGRLAGLYTLQSSGLPGSDGASFSLRGQTPVVVIDGVIANLTQFDLEEIESITVVKDALGAAMLGVRGSGGAVVVSTKKGRPERQQISFTAQTAVQESLGFPKALNAFDYATLYNEARVNDGSTPLYPDSVLQAYKNQSNSLAYPDVNWRDEITNRTSTFNRYTLSATGGNRYARYYVSLEHLNQSGFFKTVDSNAYNTNNSFKSYVIRSNVDVSITSKLTGGIYLLGRILNANEPGAGTPSILVNLLNTPANAYPLLNANGSFAGTSQFQNNLLAQTIGSGYRQNYKRDMLVNVYLKRTLDEITPGLWMQAKVAYYNTLSEDQNRSKTFAVYQRAGTGYTTFGANGTQANAQSIAYQGRTDYEEFSIGYDRTFNNAHGLSAIVLANRDNSTDGFINVPYTIIGTSGRVAYNYKGKYILEGAYGLNGSNRYPDNGATKVGFFPSVGFGWNINQEDFLKNTRWISRLKLFGSYGKTGNDNPGNFTYIQRYFDGPSVIFGTAASGNTAITEQTLANRNITFEKASKLNLGLNAAFFNDQLAVGVEYFSNRYYDLLMQRGRNTSLIGNNYPNENIGINRYKGWEAKLSWQKAVKDFEFFASANATLVRSEVLYSDEVFQRYDWMKRTGQPVGQRFGYIAESLFSTNAEITSSAKIEGYSPRPGDIKYKDLNSDGIINQFDITAIGRTKPLVYYGLSLGASWKGFDISALIQGVQNRNIYMGGINPNSLSSSYWAFQNNGLGQAFEHHLDRWTPQTAATATYPRLNIGVNDNNQANSSYWVRSGDYLRLKNAEIGYALPASLTGKFKLKTVRVFANGFNLLTASSSEIMGRDPETFDGETYPLQRVFNFGINIKF
ncbi:SusC/RagA family TonB-linked outer membrane protein [Segetibacter sp. 3557_3]|uniref:SusC/RagA family TonB-linked outer membrane protein n=1 Tax=Segetibacter sp. 3557_3 TaxID=2547429 RepID=UPI001058E00F|nr:SusC/RagA family TonB-linked outer membrane protein [Segetibacter sp. 3557_3]TDH24524.1 SusC/RagA family TonB-linked outer membrane protein [Segetibacter sp. 3557_3]